MFPKGELTWLSYCVDGSYFRTTRVRAAALSERQVILAELSILRLLGYQD